MIIVKTVEIYSEGVLEGLDREDIAECTSATMEAKAEKYGKCAEKYTDLQSEELQNVAMEITK